MPRFQYYESDAKDPYPEIREVLDRRYRRLPAEDIEAMLESANIDPEYVEDFLSTLGNVGRALPSILPVAGTVVGTAYGGPVGGAVGGAVGSAAGRALGGRQHPGQPPQAPQAPPPGSQPLQTPPQPVTPQMPGVPPAAAQLLQMICRPEVLLALIAMLMGQAGRQSIPVGPANTPVPLGAFTNMLRVMADQASAEYNATVGANGETIPRYLRDFTGEVEGDIAVPEYRARVLFEMLQEADREEDEYHREDPSEPQQLDDWIYDEMELVQLYSDYESDRG